MNWIKIEDRLPKKGESVGYTYDGKSIRRDVYYLGFNGTWESENSAGWYITEINITHWLPMPEAPNDELNALNKELQEDYDNMVNSMWRPTPQGLISEWGGTARCITSDGRNVNMAEELTRLENEKTI